MITKEELQQALREKLEQIQNRVLKIDSDLKSSSTCDCNAKIGSANYCCDRTRCKKREIIKEILDISNKL